MTTTQAPEGQQHLDQQAFDTTDVPGKFVGVYVLRPVVGVNLNAGMDGVPKQITVGNARRLRVSSQSLKRAMREWTHTFIAEDEQAVRTKKLPHAVAQALTELRDVDYQDALTVADVLFLGAGKFKILADKPARTQESVFAPRQTVTALAQIAHEHWDSLFGDHAPEIADQIAKAAKSAAEQGGRKKRTPKSAQVKLTPVTLPADLRKQVVAAFAPGASTEIALNGRMLTALPTTGAIEAATSVAHAYSVDPVTLTHDDYVLKDDWQDGGFEEDHPGAGYLDTRTLASGTLFQWAALDRTQLRTNLAATSGLSGETLEEAARHAERLFVAGAAWAVPGAAAHTTGSQTAPAFVVSTASDTPPLTPPVFEEAITENVTTTAGERLGKYLTGMQRFRPVNGGKAFWGPGTPSQPPVLPDGVSVESIW